MTVFSRIQDAHYSVAYMATFNAILTLLGLANVRYASKTLTLR